MVDVIADSVWTLGPMLACSWLLTIGSVMLRCTGIGADVAFYYWPSALVREFVAVFLSRGFLIWALVGYLLFVSPTLLLLMG